MKKIVIASLAFVFALSLGAFAGSTAVFAAGNSVQDMILSLVPNGNNVLANQVSNPSYSDHGITLYRTIRDCATGNPIGTDYPTMTNFGPGREVIHFLQIVNLDTADYYNYTCANRYQEQCINDGSFDSFYDEVCSSGSAAAPVRQTWVYNQPNIVNNQVNNVSNQSNYVGNRVNNVSNQSNYSGNYVNNVSTQTNYTNRQTNKVKKQTHGQILYRVIRDCKTGKPLGTNYPTVTQIEPGLSIFSRVQRVDLGVFKNGSYTNYTCASRYQEQCINDGSFDSYYDEYCANS